METKFSVKIQEIFDVKYYKLWDLGHVYTVLLVKEILDKTKISQLTKNKEYSIGEILDKLNFSLSALPALHWLLNFSSVNGILEKKGSNSDYKYRAIIGHKVNDNLETVGEEILSLDESWEIFLKMGRLIVDDYPLFLTGKKRGLDILFERDRVNYWNDYFRNQFSAYTAFNDFGAQVLKDIIHFYEKASLLEIGAGTGGATQKLISVLKDYGLLDKVFSYFFSDISPIFFRYGNKILLEGLGGKINYEAKKIDFNSRIINQGIPKESINIIYGVNALHVAKDLLASLKFLYEIIEPHGRLMICEHIRPSRGAALYMEIIFSLLDSYTSVEIDSNYRPSYGFLTINDWKTVFQLAGFQELEILDDLSFRKNFQREKVAMVLIAKK